MGILRDFSISAKLFVGFGFVTLLILAISAASFIALDGASDNYETYRSLARQTNASGEVQANMLTTRIFAKDFLIDPNASNVEGVRDRAQATIRMIEESRELSTTQIYQFVVDDLENDLREYVTQFDRVIEQQVMRDDLVNNSLNVVGPEVERALTAIMESARADGDAEAAFLAGVTLRNLLLARLYVQRFLIENDDASYQRSLVEFREMELNEDSLITSLQNPTRIALANEAREKTVIYKDAFENVRNVITVRNSIIENQLDRIGPRVANTIERLKLTILENQDALGPEAQAEINQTVTTTLIVSATAVGIAIVLAWVISTGISRPIQRLTSSAGTMAAGDLDVEIETGRRDEIGVLGSSLAAMRDAIRSQLKKLEDEVEERNKAEQEAAERKQVFMASADPIIIEDLEGKVIDLNKEAELAYGWTRDELLGRPIRTIVPDDKHDQAMELLNTCLNGGDVRNVEGVRQRRSGEQIPVLLSLSLLRDSDRKPIAIASVAKDITDLKQEIEVRRLAEQEASERKQVFMDSSDPIIIEDLHGSVTDMNKEAERAYGWTREQLIGEPIKRIVPEDKHSQADALLKRCLAGQEVRNVEGLRQSKNGRVDDVLITLSALSDENGKTVAIASIAKDITEIKKAERQLQEYSEDLEAKVEARTHDLELYQKSLLDILQRSPMGVSIRKPGAGDVLFANERMLELMETDLEGYAQTNQADLFESEEQLNDVKRMISEQGFLTDVELSMTSAKGTKKNLLLTSLPFTYEGQKVHLNWLYDITERKQAEERVEKALQGARSERQRSETILNFSPDPIVIVNEKEQIVYANKQTCETFGFDQDDLVGSHVERLLPERFRKHHGSLIAKFFEDRGPRTMGGGRELYALHADGHEVPVEVSLSPIEHGEEITVAAALHDITQRKQMEDQLRTAMEAAETATKAKSEFLASMSHEIRTPMNGITGMTDLLAQTDMDEDQSHMVRTIRDSGNSLITIINDILDFSKIEAGKLDIEDISMSIADTVEGVATTLTPNATKKGVRIHTYADPDIPEAMLGDPVRVRQILFNLTGNAVKFSEKKDVQVRASLLKASRDDGKIMVRFEIIDQGIGISKENQAKLFKAFSQAEMSTTRKFGGTGLGLAICMRLVEMMNGEIGVESEEGKGSTFWVELPLMPADKSRVQEKKRDLHGLNVLVVGSPEPRRTTMDAYLDHFGAEASYAPDIQSAYEQLTTALKVKSGPDSIIVDCGLNGKAQREAIEMLRKSQGRRKAKIPLILLEDYQNRDARIKDEDLLTVDANPLVRYRLVTAVAVAAGRASPQAGPTDDAVVTKSVEAPTVEEAAESGELILLAEDNPTNQDVIKRQLATLGYACEVADDGALGLAAWRTGRYCLLLTDCHMPEMDGYELAGTIRDDEKGSGNRSPIIAITANALQGEAERCLAAGMDDYLSKPVAMPLLKAKLEKWMPAADKKQATEPHTEAESPEAADSPPEPVLAEPKKTNGEVRNEPPINDRTLKDMFGDDDEMFKEILGSFLEPSVDIIEELKTGHENRSADAVKAAAHKLKSSARSVGANALADVCAELETAGKDDNWQKIDELTPSLEGLMEDVTTYIQSL